MEPVEKKRGRKRKVENESNEENKRHQWKSSKVKQAKPHARRNTFVTAPTNIGPLIDVDSLDGPIRTDDCNNSDCPITTYDCNDQETIFDFIKDDLSPIGAQFLDIEKRVCEKLMPIKYGHPVKVIYNPLTYAFQTHKDFVSKFCNSEREIMFLGMNPGQYGMSQNGVPFGEVTSVREWLKIKGDIYKPEKEHRKKPIKGLASILKERSGARFWGLFQEICHTPENFFRHCFVYNVCPLSYMKESGENITPAKLVSAERNQIIDSCSVGLVEVVQLLNIGTIIAVGRFAEKQALKALRNARINVKVKYILHPSPASPRANKGWKQIVAKQLKKMKVMKYLNSDAEEVERLIEEWEKTARSQNRSVT